MELQVREQIRRELKDFAHHIAFPQKDLRESLLECKLQNRKSEMMEDTLKGGGLDETIGLDSSYHYPGDTNQIHNTT